MAVYLDEEEAWKCPKHPSRRRSSTGICAICLRDRLVTLCPDCANARPCSCHAAATTSTSSSSSSSSFSLFSSSGRFSNLVETEPSFRRSRSLAIPFPRSRFAAEELQSVPSSNRSRASFLSVFKKNNRSKKQERQEGDTHNGESRENDGVMDDNCARVMPRSRSVCVPVTSDSCAGVASRTSSSSSSARKGRGWYFPSPMKVFRQSKVTKVSQQLSPLYRG